MIVFCRQCCKPLPLPPRTNWCFREKDRNLQLDKPCFKLSLNRQPVGLQDSLLHMSQKYNHKEQAAEIRRTVLDYFLQF